MSKFLPSYPEYDEKDFSKSINSKKEFDDVRLEPVERQPVRGEYFSFQTLLARYLSPHTPYSKALFFLEPGVGKTCAANAVHQEIKKHRGASFNKTLVLAKGKLLLDNYAQEFLDVCPGEGYGFGMLERKRLLRKNFIFSPIQKFANNVINKMSTQAIKSQFSNRLIIIDEGQDLKKIGKGSLYESMLKFFDAIEGATVIIMSGTPIVEDAYEIVSLVNLLSEPADRLPTGNAFYKKYYTDDTFNDDHRQELEDFFRGKISYIRQMGSVAPKSYISKNVEADWFEQLQVYGVCMGDFQLSVYNKSRERVDTIDVRKNKKIVSQKTQKGGAVYQYSLESSLFVFPDGTYGKDGFDKHITTRRQVRRGKKVVNETVHKIPDKWKTEFRINLEKYSAKYAEIIRLIIEKPKECFFVFNDLVNNGGLIMLGLLLELHGYKRATQPVSANEPKAKRFLMLTSATSDSQASRLIRSFSQPHNVQGEYIQVVLGSDVVSYGVTIKNLRNVVIAKPQWNWPSIEQIEARGIRPGSDAFLVKAGLPTDVSVYLMVAVNCKSKEPTTDVYLYQRAEQKFIRNDPMFGIVRRIAFDCPLSYARNVTDSKNNYQCAGMAPTGKRNGIFTYDAKDIDRTNYDQFYAANDVAQVTDFLHEHFASNFTYSVHDGVQQFTAFIFLTALEQMIDRRTPVTNAHAEICYLQEFNDIVYIQSQITDENHVSELIYVQQPYGVYDVSLSDLLDISFFELDEKLQGSFCNDPLDEAIDAFQSMNFRTQILVFESSYEFLKKGKGSKEQMEKATQVVDEYESQIYDFDGVVYHNLYSERITGTSYTSTTKKTLSTGQMRKFVDGSFEWVSLEEEEEVNKRIKTRERSRSSQAFKENDYGMYGTISSKDGKFRISTQNSKGTITRGLVCSTSMPIPSLFKTLVTLDTFPPINKKDVTLTREHVTKALLGHPKFTLKNEREAVKRGDVSTERMRQYLTILTESKSALCDFIKDEMEKKQILYNV